MAFITIGFKLMIMLSGKEPMIESVFKDWNVIMKNFNSEDSEI